MATAMADRQVSANGKRPEKLRVKGGRDRRLPFVALGVVLVAGGALVAGMLVQSAGDRVSVVSAAVSISQGQVIEQSDLAMVEVSVDPSVPTVPASSLSSLVGQVAVVPIAQGALVAPAQLAADGGLAEGTVVVGALLGPGALPTASLAPGQQVEVVSTNPEVRESLGVATVFETSPGVQSGSVFVSLAVPEAVAPEVAFAVADQQVSLLLLGAEGQS